MGHSDDNDMTTIRPKTRAIRYCIIGLDEPLTGVTQVGNLTGVNPALSVVADEDDNAFLATVPVNALPPLPASGWLEAGELYADDGRAVLVRQSHNRTSHPVDDLVPTLFLVYRADAANVLKWIAGESVVIGMLRTFENITYRCIQSHITQSDWIPPATPALWEVYKEPIGIDEWQAGVAYTIGDVVIYKGVEYKCCQSHTAQVGWEPPKVPALWLPL